jgi:hypothetical protein
MSNPFTPGNSDVPLPDEDPDETTEGMRMLDFEDALKMIAYPKNWPQVRSIPDLTHESDNLLNWMQAVAAHALTNAGTYNYERRAKP